MIIDTSALVAIVHDEPDGGQYLNAILQAPVRRVSAGNLFETDIVIDGAQERVVSERFHELLRNLRVVVEPVTEAQGIIARTAHKRLAKAAAMAPG